MKLLQVSIISLLFVSYYCLSDNNDNSTIDKCLLESLKAAKPHQNVAEIKAHCEVEIIRQKEKSVGLSDRFLAELESEFNPFVITPHKQNYILPITYTDNFNYEPYEAVEAFGDNFENTEAKYQLSIKVPINTESIFFDYDQLYFGMTIVSWWQIYAQNISKPFRETNYQPEIFYITPTKWHPFDGNLYLGLGLEHQSNGRSQLLSRSWNRVYTELIFEKDDFIMALRPWYRIKEDEKITPLSTEGDDNPDIEDYMGNFELSLGYHWNKFEFTALARQNFSTHNGAVQLDVTYPIWGRLLGYAQYFNGYGESLIDYNHRQQKIGIGIALTNYF
jgi:phospholipase A1